MGIMSKSGRLPQRPQPPSWEAIMEDITGASDDDVVFSVGKDNLSKSRIYQSATALNQSGSVKSSSPSTSSQQNSDLDSSVDSEKVRDSYSQVIRLITLYKDLEKAPTDLQAQYKRLKEMGEDTTDSIAQLKSLSQSIVEEETLHSEKSKTSERPPTNKSKSKLKKKK